MISPSLAATPARRAVRTLLVVGACLPQGCSEESIVGGSPLDESTVIEILRPSWSEWPDGSLDSRRDVIRDQAAWEIFWIAFAVRPPDFPDPPEVDFSEHMVIAASRGLVETTNHRIEIDGVRFEGESMIYADVTVTFPDDACPTQAIPTAPVVMVLVETQPNEVRFRETLTTAC